MVVSYPRLFEKIQQTYVAMADLDRLCDKTALKLKHQNTESN